MSAHFSPLEVIYMVTIGSVLAVLGVVLGICLSSWAVIVGFTALFPSKTQAANEAIQNRPWRSTIVGLVIWLTLGLIGFALLQVPNPVVRLVGMIWLMVIFGVTCVGAAGLSTLIASRLRTMGDMNDYGATCRAATIVVTAGLLPLVGWFAVIPMVLSVSLGAGIAAIMRKPASRPQPSFETGA